MNSPPLFSILTPAFNEESHIAEMIASVQAQSFPDWELVIVDDGSSDHTASIVAGYAADDPRIIVAGAGERLGKVRAFNRAFEESRGSILFHLGADDTMGPDALRVRLSAFDRTAAGGVEASQSAFFKMRTVSDDRKFDGMVLPRGSAVSKTSSSPTYTRDLAQQIFPIPDRLVSEDLWIGFLAEVLSDRATFVEKVVWNYRIHAGNSNPRHKQFGEMDAAISQRMRVWSVLLESNRYEFSSEVWDSIESRREIEFLRHNGRLFGLLLRRDVSLVDRLAYCSMANRFLFYIRSRFYRQLTGLRGA